MASASAALGLTNSHIVHEKRNLNIKSIFAKGHALPGSSHIPVRIALKQRNLDKGMDYLMAVLVTSFNFQTEKAHLLT